MLKKLLLGFICSVGISSGVLAGDITSTGKSDADVYTYYGNIKSLVNDLAMRAKTQCLTSAGLAGTSTKVRTLNTGNTFAVVNGAIVVLGSSTQHSNTLGTTAVGTATGTHQIYIMTVSSGGTVTATEGTPSNATATVSLPNIPENQAMLGFLWLYGSGSTAFLPGTHSVTWATVTANYVNTLGMIDFIPGTGSINSLSLTDL